MVIKDLNLLPLEVLNKRQAKQRTRIMVLLLILSVLVCLMVAQNLAIKKWSLESKKADYTVQIDKLKEIETLDAKLTSEKQKLTQYQDLINNAGTTPEIYKRVMDAFEKNMPDKVFIIELNLSNEKVTARCAAINEMQVADFIKRLKDSGDFENIFVSELNKDGNSASDKKEDKRVNFSLSCTTRVQKGSTK